MRRRSLKSRLIVASLLWTGGLLMLMHLASLHLMHTLPRFRGDHSWGPTLVGVAVMAAAFYWARKGLEPFQELKRQVRGVKDGASTRVEGEYPAEVQPLVDEVNALLEHREKSYQRALSAAGDLAHALKTPLALLSREAESIAERDAAAAMEQQIERMSNQVNYHLARARLAASGPAPAARTSVAACVEALVRALRKIHAARELEYSLDVDSGLYVKVRREDLDEILGNVLDNAAKWAQGRVSVAARRDGAVVEVVIEDDGPGLAGAMRHRVLERGVRLDESAPGSGLGLSIVRDLTEHYGGGVELDRSTSGGLRVVVRLP